MKKEILMLIIGILIGAIIATGVFLVLKGGNEMPSEMQRGMGGDMPFGDENMIERGEGGERIEDSNLVSE